MATHTGTPRGPPLPLGGSQLHKPYSYSPVPTPLGRSADASHHTTGSRQAKGSDDSNGTSIAIRPNETSSGGDLPLVSDSIRSDPLTPITGSSSTPNCASSYHYGVREYRLRWFAVTFIANAVIVAVCFLLWDEDGYGNAVYPAFFSHKKANIIFGNRLLAFGVGILLVLYFLDFYTAPAVKRTSPQKTPSPPKKPSPQATTSLQSRNELLYPPGHEQTVSTSHQKDAKYCDAKYCLLSDPVSGAILNNYGQTSAARLLCVFGCFSVLISVYLNHLTPRHDPLSPLFITLTMYPILHELLWRFLRGRVTLDSGTRSVVSGGSLIAAVAGNTNSAEGLLEVQGTPVDLRPSELRNGRRVSIRNPQGLRALYGPYAPPRSQSKRGAKKNVSKKKVLLEKRKRNGRRRYQQLEESGDEQTELDDDAINEGSLSGENPESPDTSENTTANRTSSAEESSPGGSPPTPESPPSNSSISVPESAATRTAAEFESSGSARYYYYIQALLGSTLLTAILLFLYFLHRHASHATRDTSTVSNYANCSDALIRRMEETNDDERLQWSGSARLRGESVNHLDSHHGAELPPRLSGVHRNANTRFLAAAPSTDASPVVVGSKSSPSDTDTDKSDTAPPLSCLTMEAVRWATHCSPLLLAAALTSISILLTLRLYVDDLYEATAAKGIGKQKLQDANKSMRALVKILRTFLFRVSIVGLLVWILWVVTVYTVYSGIGAFNSAEGSTTNASVNGDASIMPGNPNPGQSFRGSAGHRSGESSYSTQSSHQHRRVHLQKRSLYVIPHFLGVFLVFGVPHLISFFMPRVGSYLVAEKFIPLCLALYRGVLGQRKLKTHNNRRMRGRRGGDDNRSGSSTSDHISEVAASTVTTVATTSTTTTSLSRRLEDLLNSDWLRAALVLICGFSAFPLYLVLSFATHLIRGFRKGTLQRLHQNFPHNLLTPAVANQIRIAKNSWNWTSVILKCYTLGIAVFVIYMSATYGLTSFLGWFHRHLGRRDSLFAPAGMLSETGSDRGQAGAFEPEISESSDSGSVNSEKSDSQNPMNQTTVSALSVLGLWFVCSFLLLQIPTMPWPPLYFFAGVVCVDLFDREFVVAGSVSPHPVDNSLSRGWWVGLGIVLLATFALKFTIVVWNQKVIGEQAVCRFISRSLRKIQHSWNGGFVSNSHFSGATGSGMQVNLVRSGGNCGRNDILHGATNDTSPDSFDSPDRHARNHCGYCHGRLEAVAAGELIPADRIGRDALFDSASNTPPGGVAHQLDPPSQHPAALQTHSPIQRRDTRFLEFARRRVGVQRPFIRGIELLLMKKGLSRDKCAILVGGPDWPTGVLCGLLRCDLKEILIGSLPSILPRIPVVCAGAFLAASKKLEQQFIRSSSNFQGTGSTGAPGGPTADDVHGVTRLADLMAALAVIANAWAGITATATTYKVLKKHPILLSIPRRGDLRLHWLDYCADKKEAVFSKTCEFSKLGSIMIASAKDDSEERRAVALQDVAAGESGGVGDENDNVDVNENDINQSDDSNERKKVESIAILLRLMGLLGKLLKVLLIVGLLLMSISAYAFLNVFHKIDRASQGQLHRTHGFQSLQVFAPPLPDHDDTSVTSRSDNSPSIQPLVLTDFGRLILWCFAGACAIRVAAAMYFSWLVRNTIAERNNSCNGTTDPHAMSNASQQNLDANGQVDTDSVVDSDAIDAEAGFDDDDDHVPRDDFESQVDCDSEQEFEQVPPEMIAPSMRDEYREWVKAMSAKRKHLVERLRMESPEQYQLYIGSLAKDRARRERRAAARLILSSG